MPRVMKVIGIVGSRRRNTIADKAKCTKAVWEIYRFGDAFVSGGCREGGDQFAQEIAQSIGVSITIHYPRRYELDSKLAETNARAAYAKINYARNTLIAEECDILVAVVAEDRTGGTEDTIKKVLKLGKPVIYV